MLDWVTSLSQLPNPLSKRIDLSQESILSACKNCPLSKYRQCKFPVSTHHQTKASNLIHMHLAGPMKTQSIQGHNYLFIIADNYSFASSSETAQIVSSLIVPHHVLNSQKNRNILWHHRLLLSIASLYQIICDQCDESESQSRGELVLPAYHSSSLLLLSDPLLSSSGSTVAVCVKVVPKRRSELDQ